MHFATRVKTWSVARLYSKIALYRKPFGIERMYIYVLLRMTDTMTSHIIDHFSWDILYMSARARVRVRVCVCVRAFEIEIF
jgi:hypothetical protein